MKIKMSNKLHTKVGIFLRIDCVIVSDTVYLKQGEPYGGAVQHGGHFVFHKFLESANPHENRLKSSNYQ